MKLPSNYKEKTARKIYKIPDSMKMYPVNLRKSQIAELKKLKDEIELSGVKLSVAEMIRTAIDEHIANTKRRLHYDPNKSHYFS